MRVNVTRLIDDLDCSLSEYRKARDLLGLLDLDCQRRKSIPVHKPSGSGPAGVSGKLSTTPPNVRRAAVAFFGSYDDRLVWSE